MPIWPVNITFISIISISSLRKATLSRKFYIFEILLLMSLLQFGQNNHGLKLLESTDIIWITTLILVESLSSSIFINIYHFNIQIRLNCYQQFFCCFEISPKVIFYNFQVSNLVGSLFCYFVNKIAKYC